MKNKIKTFWAYFLILLMISIAIANNVQLIKSEKLSIINSSSRAEYSTPNTGVVWSMDDLVANSSGNVTYDSENYTIHNTTKISKKDTLIIKPGTLIKLKEITAIRVYGTLIAKGTKKDMITFTQDPTGDKWPEYFPDHWSGLKFFDTCNYEKCILNYCRIEHAGNGIVLFNAPITISNNIITSRFDGISVYGTPPIIRNNTLNCHVEALSFERSYPVFVENCYFESGFRACVELFNSTVFMYNCSFVTDQTRHFIIEKESYLYLYNTSFEQSKIYFDDINSSIFINWYLGIEVIDFEQNPIEDTKIILTDKNAIEILNQTTESTGKIENIFCKEYELRDLTGDGDCLDDSEMIFHTPHQIIVTKEEYQKHEEEIEITQDKNIVITLYQPPKLVIDISSNNFMYEDRDNGDNLIDLEEYFSDDIDDEHLTFEVIYEENNSLLDAEIDGRYLDLTQKKDDWYGTLQFQVKAADSHQLECLSNIFTVTVKPTNDYPIITAVKDIAIVDSQVEFDLTQNEYFNATINVTELDGEQLSFSTNISSPNFILNPNTGDIVFQPCNDDVGTIYGYLEVMDENLTKDKVKITLNIENVNDPPDLPLIITPTHGREFKTTDFITFNGTCDDLDLHIKNSEEELRYLWWSNINGKLGEGKFLQNVLLDRGIHTITLEVFDKEGSDNSTSITITIKGDNIMVIIQPPFCTLLTPINEEIITTKSLNLTWETNFTEPSMITYDVYLDTDPYPRTLVAKRITDTKYLLQDLEDGGTYYWKVVPYLGDIRGNCTTGIYKFNIYLDFEPIDNNDNEKKSDKNSTFLLFVLLIIIIIIIVIIVTWLFYKKKRAALESLKTRSVTIKPGAFPQTFVTQEQVPAAQQTPQTVRHPTTQVQQQYQKPPNSQ